MMADNKEAQKLFPSEKINDSKCREASKFITEIENKNGVSPVSVESLKSAFTGLTKEELMKYAKDPFWVRIRWILFIAFWLIWLLMLFGAIFIIIVTPKCKKQPPQLWWQESPLYRINVTNLVVENQTVNPSIIDMLRTKIDHLKVLGIKSLMLDSVLEAHQDASDEVMNFTNVNYYLESLDKFRTEIVEYAKSKDIKIILSFTPNHSGKNEIFIRSSLKEDDYYANLYVWYPQNYTNKPSTYPNNWLSVYDNTAWEWSEKRKQFYLHQFHINQPDFNFRNPAILKMFTDIFEFWLRIGIAGFHLDKTEYLVEDEKFKDETPNYNTSYNHQQYGFYHHYHTCELPETTAIISQWSSLIRNHSAILSVSGGINEESDIADFVLRPLLFSSNLTAIKLNDRIIKWCSAVNQPTWQWKCDSDVKCISDTAVDALFIISFLLPGTPIITLGDEFNSSDASILAEKYSEQYFKKTLETEKNKPNSRYIIIKYLIDLRTKPSIKFGNIDTKVLNETTFAYTRVKTGNPGYLVVWNLGNETTTINCKEFPKVPDDLMVVIRSKNLYNNMYPLKSRVYSSEVKIPSMAAIVFSFVPVSK